MTKICLDMKRYIDKQLLQLERSISFFRCWCAECHDSYFVEDGRYFAAAVESCQNICRVYYKHWINEFTVPMYHRYLRLVGFDVWREYFDYVRKYGVRGRSVSSDDIPF